MILTRLQAICDNLGYSAGETAICAAMEDIAADLAQAQVAWEAGDLDGLHGGAERLGTLADSVGMTALSRVARDAGRLCAAYDDAALGAVVARMARIGTLSLLSVWEAQDQSL